MDAQQAIAILAGKANGDSYEAIKALEEAVIDASEYGDPDNSLQDWIGNGQYTGEETVESIAAEWDERDE